MSRVVVDVTVEAVIMVVMTAVEVGGARNGEGCDNDGNEYRQGGCWWI